jgi:hypothetical protein
MKIRATLSLAALLLATLGRVSALEVSSGTLRLVLHQGISRFSLYAEGVPLFVDHDPRTSSLAIMVENKVYRLGDSSEFRESSEALPQGARFTWTSPRLTVTESFSLAAPPSLLITVTATNTSERDLRFGLRLFLDTRLGEEPYPHFQTDLQPEINGELTLLRPNLPRYWLSSSFRSKKPAGLLCLLQGPEVTEPDRVVFANWKRMSEAYWSYETSPARSFSDLPYSINDSAVFQYYDPQILARGGSRTVNIVLQAAKPGLPDLPPKTRQPAQKETPAAGEAVVTAPEQTPSETTGTAPVQTPVEPAGAAPGEKPREAAPRAPAEATPKAPVEPPAEILSIRGDLRVLDNLLQELERKLSSRAAFSEEELRVMEQVLADLRKRLEKPAK